MSRAVLLSMLLLLAVAPAARAELRVIDTTAGKSQTLLQRGRVRRESVPGALDR